MEAFIGFNNSLSIMADVKKFQITVFVEYQHVRLFCSAIINYSEICGFLRTGELFGLTACSVYLRYANKIYVKAGVIMNRSEI